MTLATKLARVRQLAARGRGASLDGAELVARLERLRASGSATTGSSLAHRLACAEGDEAARVLVEVRALLDGVS